MCAKANSRSILLVLTVVSLTSHTYGQNEQITLVNHGSVRHDAIELLHRFPRDQAEIFTSPLRVTHHEHAWRFVAPFAVAAAMIPFDKHISAQLPSGHGGPSRTISDVGLYGTAASVGVLYIYGVLRHDDHARETGLLGTESLMNSVLPPAALSLVFGRYRPFQGPMGEQGEGDFFRNNVYAASFPSGHSIYTWSMATTIADEYPSTPNKLVWFGVGTTVAISRITAREHFVSDVIAGSAIGYLIGRHIFHKHHSFH
jgi:membrane-associated phospholipid phosphatase